MLYLKAKKDTQDYFTGHEIIKNELITLKEREKHYNHLPDSCFEIVEISSRKTFMNFGVRFEIKN